MKTKSNIYNIKIIIFLVIFTGSFLSACTSVEEEENPVSISNIALSSSNVNLGEPVTVTIYATDKEGRTLNYRYNASGGDFNAYENTSNVATWIAPMTQGGNYSITGTAYAGSDEASMSVPITVTSMNEPTISFIFPTEGISVTAVNHENFSFQAYHDNGISDSQGLIIHFYEGDQQNDSIISSPISVTNPSGDLKTYIISFDLDLNGIIGQCKLEYSVQSRISAISSQLVNVNFTVEAVTQEY